MAPEKLGKGAPEKVMVGGAEAIDDLYVVAVGTARTGNVLYVASLQFKHCVLQKLCECEVHGILSAPEIIQYYFASSEVSDKELAQCIAMKAGKDLDLVQAQRGHLFSFRSRPEIIRSYLRNHGDIITCIMGLAYALYFPLFLFQSSPYIPLINYNSVSRSILSLSLLSFFFQIMILGVTPINSMSLLAYSTTSLTFC